MVRHNHDGKPSRGRYDSGCRHPDCVEANRVYRMNYRIGRTKQSASRVWLNLEPSVTEWVNNPTEENEKLMKNRLRMAVSGMLGQPAGEAGSR